MLKPIAITLLALLVMNAGAVEYPETRQVDQTDDYHGTQVADPYRWLEDDVRESEAVADWVTRQNQLSYGYLENLPEREPIRERLTELWNYERFGAPEKRGDNYFYFRNNGLQNQSVMYVQNGLDGEPRVLIDPNEWADDGTVALAQTEISPDGSMVAYGIQDGGSDWRTFRVLNVATGEPLDDELKWLKFTNVSWTRDNQGFYYARYPAPDEDEQFQSLNKDMKVYYHKIGTDQSADRLVFATPDHPEWGFAPQVTEDGRYLLITVWKGTDDRYQLAWLDLNDPEAEVNMLIEGFDHDYTLVGSDESILYFRTSNDAPKGRVIAIDLTRPDPAHWREVIPESADVLTSAGLIGGKIVAHYLKDARSLVRIYDTTKGLERDLSLPGIGRAQGFSGSEDDPETFYLFSSLNQPPTVYRYDVVSGEQSAWKTSEVAFNPDDFVVRQVFYQSKDGTRVPMLIGHRKGIALDGSNPTLLYGYGGFNISVTPTYSTIKLAWMDMGGVFAQANLRGGGEYGEAWHKAGTKGQKQNVFDDFIAAAEYLVTEKYTSPEHLAIYGRSNGGLLVGATLNQRPDLFAAALPAVGVMDMLRFDQFTAGRFWVDDYGSSSNPEEFEALYAYSPYHNIEATAYPPTLVTTADTDDRVVPGHSFKYAARLQEHQQGEAPVLIRIETRAGHGSGKPTEMQIAEYADMWAFIAHHTGLDPAPEKSPEPVASAD